VAEQHTVSPEPGDPQHDRCDRGDLVDLFGLLAPDTATAFGEAWLPVSNAKAKAELNWKPTTGPGT
jgi:hypothetical protein